MFKYETMNKPTMKSNKQKNFFLYLILICIKGEMRAINFNINETDIIQYHFIVDTY